MNNFRVAICQSSIIPGGRFRVVLSIIKTLNELGIIPDLLTANLVIHTDEISRMYGMQPRAKYRIVPRVPKLSHDFAIVAFNASLGYCAKEYDLLINTSNSLLFLPKRQKIVNYIFFPRKRRIMAKTPNLHLPDSTLPRWSRSRINLSILRGLYRFSKLRSNYRIVCMTEFTRKALEQEYPMPADAPTIYPPVDISKFYTTHRERADAVVTIGRFSPNKRQLEQIKIAEKLPNLPFHIMGFADDTSYYQQCVEYVQVHHLAHVHLYPNVSFDEMIAILQQSKFFLHTLINEPFGLTAVQAIAAGCLPIVHDSGGQREVIIDSALRYQNSQQATDILNHFQNCDKVIVDTLVSHLQRHILESFSENTFQESMRSLLIPYVT